MIRKLRIKFVVTNMAIFTIMLTLLLGFVFYFTGAQMGEQNIRMMQQLPVSGEKVLPNTVSEQVRLPYFLIRLGPKGERVSVHGSYYDLSNEKFLDDLMGRVNAGEKRTGVLENYRLRYCFVDAPHSRYLVFSDISSELTTMNQLKWTCILLGAAGFFIFLAISIWLSAWAVRPIDRAMKQERQFIADASHELKTPLTVLMTNAQLLQAKGESESVRTRCTEGILVMAQQMRSLVEQLLELARMDSDEREKHFTELDLSDLWSEALLPFDPVFFERGLTLDTRLQDGVRVSGNRDQLRQLLEILLDNAQKYARPGGRAEVRLERSNRGRCLLTVRNQGEPLTGEELAHLFQRFYRADRARSRNGSFGLGLSIAETIVSLHRGRLWAESRDGWNTFFVELPSI